MSQKKTVRASLVDEHDPSPEAAVERVHKLFNS